MKKIISAIILMLTSLSASTQNMNLLRKLQIAEYAISNFYVDDVDEEKLVENAIRGMLETLDPHSTYSTAEEVRKMNEQLNGNFEGVGIQFNMTADTLFVIQTIAGGPAEKAGLQAGDRIISANGTTIAGVKMSTEQIMSLLRGPKGTIVEVSVVRKGADDTLQFRIVRDKIPLNSINASFMAAPHIGYIKIDSFGATTHKEFNEAVRNLREKGMKDLILDLQGNGGGYLNAAVDVVNEFLSRGDTIVYTKGKHSKDYSFVASGGYMKKERLVVLIDDFSASASEITAGAIQDQDRGVVIGRRSFGKGLVQRPIDLPDSSMIKLTVSRYYIPSGRCIQKSYEDKKEYDEDLINRYNNGEMSSADSIHFPDSLKYKTVRLKRIVYGGGGIMPDIFVPLDTTKVKPLYREMMNKNIIIDTSVKYIDAHRDELKTAYKNFEEYMEKFEIDDAVIKSMEEAAVKEGITVNDTLKTEALPLIKLQLKALIARDIWTMNEYSRIIASMNDPLQKALEILHSGKYETILGRKN